MSTDPTFKELHPNPKELVQCLQRKFPFETCLPLRTIICFSGTKSPETELRVYVSENTALKIGARRCHPTDFGSKQNRPSARPPSAASRFSDRRALGYTVAMPSL